MVTKEARDSSAQLGVEIIARPELSDLELIPKLLVCRLRRQILRQTKAI